MGHYSPLLISYDSWPCFRNIIYLPHFFYHLSYVHDYQIDSGVLSLHGSECSSWPGPQFGSWHIAAIRALFSPHYPSLLPRTNPNKFSSRFIHSITFYSRKQSRIKLSIPRSSRKSFKNIPKNINLSYLLQKTIFKNTNRNSSQTYSSILFQKKTLTASPRTRFNFSSQRSRIQAFQSTIS